MPNTQTSAAILSHLNDLEMCADKAILAATQLNREAISARLQYRNKGIIESSQGILRVSDALRTIAADIDAHAAQAQQLVAYDLEDKGPERVVNSHRHLRTEKPND